MEELIIDSKIDGYYNKITFEGNDLNIELVDKNTLKGVFAKFTIREIKTCDNFEDLYYVYMDTFIESHFDRNPDSKLMLYDMDYMLRLGPSGLEISQGTTGGRFQGSPKWLKLTEVELMNINNLIKSHI